MSTIAYLTNAAADSGVGHQAQELSHALAQQAPQHQLTTFLIDGRACRVQQQGHTIFQARAWPGVLGQKTISWLRLGYRLKRELRQRADIDIVHATNQTLSFIIDQSHPSVVTVHDIIELTHPQSRAGAWAAKILYQGIARATHIIAVSHYTAGELTSKLNIPASRLSVIHNGVSQEFHPLTDFKNSIAYHTLQSKLKLSGGPIILYVGSEHPRKNVRVAIEAFARVREQHPQALFIKVGAPGFLSGRAQLLADIERHNLRESVRLLGPVTIERLNELYNLADVLIFPSTQEGFGLPPLQAMAAGTPVVCSNATSLPEVVGEAALLNNPNDTAGFARDLLKVVEDPSLAEHLRIAGQERAKQFSWTAAAAATSHIYDNLKR